MPPKARPPAPIDRPLSKAYLREFAGWSTAYPPGLSEPNSIRTMENVMVARDGAARVRPGMQSYMRTKAPLQIVGSHELFYTERGKAYLVAVRETADAGTEDEREIVGFRVIGPDSTGAIVMDTLEAFGFSVPIDPFAISFTAATTYVKYLQIDNKIFALPNAAEGMLMFWVGDEKKAKRLQSIERPAWNVADKLTAMHPSSSWVSGNAVESTRKNLCTNPDFETNTLGWYPGYADVTGLSLSPDCTVGTQALVIQSLPARLNYATSPLHSVATTGTTGWTGVFGAVSASGANLRLTVDPNMPYAWAETDLLAVPAGRRMRAAFELEAASGTRYLRTWIAFYSASGALISTTDALRTTSLSDGRKYTSYVSVPTQAAFARLQIGLEQSTLTGSGWVEFKDVCFSLDSDNQAKLNGAMGTGYYWDGVANASRSGYQTVRDVWVKSTQYPVVPGSHTVSADMKAPAGRDIEIELKGFNSSGSSTTSLHRYTHGTGAFVRESVTYVVPTGTTRIEIRLIMRAASGGDRLNCDAILLETGAIPGTYFSGNTAGVGTTKRRWAATPNASISIEEVLPGGLPTPQTPTADTLVCSDRAKNRYSFSFFYTISNELGECAASETSVIKVQRGWTMWKWLDSGGADTDDPTKCVDQLVVTMPAEVFDNAVASGATKWTAYYFSQGPNDAPSVTAMRFAEIDLTNDPDRNVHGWARLTTQMARIGTGDPLVPSESTRLNATDPVKGSQGIVAADRLILVGNPADPARITWSSGAPGDYHNFSTLLGGGSKQLTSGNLYTTACVKLWQNPQSVDTLTILNSGDDGRSNAYYMQPANITSLSESISVMGFEEVTSLMGTVSPYGCEVVSSALFRPLFHGLFKSTANNYNLSTKPVSDSIQNVWRTLQNPHRIVSSQLDSRIYFLVHNIFGEPLEDCCRGNEIWVIDLATTTPSWSRWIAQGVSLRAMEVNNAVMMSIVRPDGIFVFNEDRYTDERFNETSGDLETVNIKWYLETNIQGANRAHDAWANLQQANIMAGNFLGQMRYGIRGKDVNGKNVVAQKVVLSTNPPPANETDGSTGDFVMPTLRTTEREDYLLVRKIMKEWMFFAGSVNDTVDEVLVPRFSGGQVNSVQYRYTPATVNVGYEYGSVETFEYGQSYAANATTDSGTPVPYVDMSFT